MAQYTIDVPSALSTTLVAAVQEHFGEDVDGMSDTDAVKHAIKESLKPIVKGYSLRHADSQKSQKQKQPYSKTIHSSPQIACGWQ